jgi:ribonucleoside-diphosphate reductase alpha chain
MLFKYGSGTGTDLTPLRSYREKLAGGGSPSGPLSFMQVYDRIAAVVKSGGKTRRAAKMQSLKVTHPDILEFIEAKGKEEAKARALIRQGYEANFNGEAYSSVFFQNANFSVRVTDDFMEAVEKGDDWTTHWVTDSEKEGPSYPARTILEKISKGTWNCGDPGLQYDTTINRWHTSPHEGAIGSLQVCDNRVAHCDSIDFFLAVPALKDVAGAIALVKGFFHGCVDGISSLDHAERVAQHH